MADGPSNPEGVSRRRFLQLIGALGVRSVLNHLLGGQTFSDAAEASDTDTFEEDVRLASKIKFVETPSPCPDHQTISWNDTLLTDSIKNDTFIAIKTFRRLGVDWPIIQQIVNGREIARIAGELSYAPPNRIEIGEDPRTVIHEFAHAGFMVKFDGKRWDGLMESSAQWFSDHALETLDSSGDKPFGGCGNGQPGTYDYAGGARTFDNLVKQFIQLAQPHLFGIMINAYGEWVNQDIENHRGQAMPAEMLFEKIGATYRLSTEEVHKKFTEPIAFGCTIEYSN